MLSELEQLQRLQGTGDTYVRAIRTLAGYAWTDVARQLERWDTAATYASTNHWRTKGDPTLVSWPEAARLVQELVASICDRPFGLTVFPRTGAISPEVARACADLQMLLKGWWQTLNWDNVLAEIVTDILIYGVGYSVVGWDQDVRLPVWKREHPVRIWPDPEASDLSECEYLIRIRTLPLSVMRVRWPHIRLRDVSVDRTKRAGASPRPLVDSPADAEEDTGAPMGWFSAKGTAPAPVTFRDVMEIWVRIPGMEPYDWRVFTIYDDQLLEIRHERRVRIIPHFGWKPRPTWWGTGIVEHLVPLNRVIDSLVTQIWRVARKTGQPKLKVPASAADLEARTTADESVLSIPDPLVPAVDYLRPPELPAYTAQIIQMAVDAAERIAGFSIGSAGASSTQTRTASEVAALQERSYVLVRQLARMLQTRVADVMETLLETAIEAVPRLSGPTLVHGDRPIVDIDTSILATDRLVSLPEGDVFVRQSVPIGVAVEAWAAMSIPRSRLEQVLLMLYDRGIIDAEAVLVGLGWPGALEALERVRTKIQQQQEQTEAAIREAIDQQEEGNAVQRSDSTAQPFIGGG